jgi:hypothetical protein
MQAQSNAVRHPQTRTPRHGACLLVAGVLMPGGFLLLAWLLARWILRRVDRAALRRAAPMLLLAACLQGCATRLDLPGEGQAQAAGPALRFQKLSAAPAQGEAFIGPEALRPGDILLTSMPGFAAASIELMTLAPVSHAALYVGEGRVVEAVRSGVGERSIQDVLEVESVALVLRHPELSPAQARRIGQYARQKTGAGFNFVGVWLQIPYSVGRRLVCELPLLPGGVREGCLRGLGVLSQLGTREGRLFCSQLVLQAYRHAGLQLTGADPRMVSPADILHMREGDVSSLRIGKALRYIGHLKYDRPLLTAQAER